MIDYNSPKLQAQLQEFMLDLARLNRKATERLDGTELRNSRVKLLDFITKYSKEEIIPKWEESKLRLYSGGRASRGFEAELESLWNRAIVNYQQMSASEMIRNLPAIVSEQILEGDDGYAREGFEAAARMELLSITIPVIEGYATPGDDILLYAMDVLTNPGDDAEETIAEHLIAPTQMLYSYLCIFGLLIEARRTMASNRATEAYTYLIDASYMLGMLESSAWLMPRFDKIAASRNGKLRARKETPKKAAIRQAKDYVKHLFDHLMPTDATGIRKWKSADAAKFEVNAYLAEKNITLGISADLIDKECVILHRADKMRQKVNKFNVLVNFVFVKKDGTKVNIPVPIND
ncbi:hypothetical protein [Pseudomonas mosselii]|uniref:Uncharacterized protein n=1 Tax=Pseudomonas mosselii TaxID=78327 RepID=A0A7W2Q0T7_9PSED|nr:hypothetical protein [Pseudomonas mosselii]MBA6067803.1 hypothetical protein [Pseudomonas mosselii]MEB5933512.1 hypothetical protein [Pseudomonas mosselii]